ncbi:MAG: HypC/HybG/HupF family hydrogenase formation chaperone [Lentisphaerae bacterium]|nr:HypC/HybG/HupF family hydrogenase formation chaperone [Lentisphaerota bacterium]
MCYAIPGRVVELEGRRATIDYFGERRKAYTDLLTPALGDYVYAQGGFVIQTVPAPEAAAILADWKELFFRLQQTDRKLAHNPRTLYERANAVRQQEQGNACCVHGILEFSIG